MPRASRSPLTASARTGPEPSAKNFLPPVSSLLADRLQPAYWLARQASTGNELRTSSALGQPSVAKLSWRPKTTSPVEGETVRTLLDLIAALEDNDDVQNVYANFEVSDDALAKFAA